jgi:hypothetical protein
MSKHLNIYCAYTKKSREGFQLEDDLTRALAILLQENDLFLHQFIKTILNQKQGAYESLFDDFTDKKGVEIDIQKPVESIEPFDHLFAVRVSGDAMDPSVFFKQTHDRSYNPITDMYIHIDNYAIIFEVKPRDQDSTAQLYNQALNTTKDREDEHFEDIVTPVDFNWRSIMELAVRTDNYQKAIARPSRLLSNFISFIKAHNYQWLPELSLSALTLSENDGSIKKRLSDAIENSEFELLGNRLGFKCNYGWAQEVLIDLRIDTQELIFIVYPGNTRGQGWHLFKEEGEPEFKKTVELLGEDRAISKSYHIKFSNQRYLTGLTFSDDALKTRLYTKDNFLKHTGRKKRDRDWDNIKSLFDSSFKEEFMWQEKSEWKNILIKKNYTQFDLSFGYELSFTIPYSDFQKIDVDKNNLEPVSELINSVNRALEFIVLQK